MSTKMHNYRVNKEQWWAFATTCRRYYREHYPIAEVLRELVDRSDDSARMDTFKRVQRVVEAFTGSNDWTVSLQVFDEGNTYLVRPLEQGWFFANELARWSSDFVVTPVSYDNRSDVPPADEANKVVAQWCDARIEAKEYLLFTVLDREDFISIAIENLVQGGRNSE